MATFSAFSAPGRWFRGNCHTHTNLSDGKGTPQETAELYRSAGYDFLVLTDHWKCHAEVESLCRKGFLVVPGIELHPPAGAPNTVVPHHIVGLGVGEAPSKARMLKQTVRAALRWIERHGGIAVYAHPYWSGHTIEPMREGRGAFGVEAFNNVCEVERGLGDSSAHVDMALSAGIGWRIFAVDDLHRPQRDLAGGWIMVKARQLTRPAILRAIRRGHFYATQGPILGDVRLVRDTVRVECSPAKAIVLHMEGPFGRALFAAEGPLTAAEFNVRTRRGRTKYLRVEIIDATGRKAWSNPIWFDMRRRCWADEL
jgi:hypothetical protein